LQLGDSSNKVLLLTTISDNDKSFVTLAKSSNIKAFFIKLHYYIKILVINIVSKYNYESTSIILKFVSNIEYYIVQSDASNEVIFLVLMLMNV